MPAPRRILCIGAGPAGLYFALLAKQADPSRAVRVVERNRRDDTFGWGVVFSDQTLGNLEAADAPTAREITGAFHHWDDIDVHFRGRTVTSGGHGFCGIGRKRCSGSCSAAARRSGSSSSSAGRSPTTRTRRATSAPTS
jgi:anthraniloyl-CoA monooxygenase